MSAVDYFLATGSMDRVDEVIAKFIRDENAKVNRAFRTLARPECWRCRHLGHTGPCAHAYCSCPGPESPG